MVSTADTVLLNLRQDSQRSTFASAGRLVLRPVFLPSFTIGSSHSPRERVEPDHFSHRTSTYDGAELQHIAGRQNNAGIARVLIGPSVTLG